MTESDIHAETLCSDFGFMRRFPFAVLEALQPAWSRSRAEWHALRKDGCRRFRFADGESASALRMPCWLHALSVPKHAKWMGKTKKGTQKSGKSGKAKSRKQAIAIGLSKARKKGAKVPKKKKWLCRRGPSAKVQQKNGSADSGFASSSADATVDFLRYDSDVQSG